VPQDRAETLMFEERRGANPAGVAARARRGDVLVSVKHTTVLWGGGCGSYRSATAEWCFSSFSTGWQKMNGKISAERLRLGTKKEG